ncbi:MAG: IS1634 family transposase [Micropruina sp.]|nr:IS1634 family transposase [Micropruina sp.]
MDDDQAYRAMDVLIQADAQAKVQEAVFFAVANLLNLEVDVLLFDTTSTYFERDTEEEGDAAFRLYGHSKDHRKDLPQIVIGLAVTKEGIPVRCWCWPGNTTDVTVLPEVKDSMRDWRLGRVVTVVDRGFSSEANLAYLKRAGGHYIAGERMRDGSPLVEASLSRQGRYSQVRDNLRVKEVRLEASPDRRWVICHNPSEAERDKTQRDAALDHVHAELDRIKTLRDRAAKTPAKPAAKTNGKTPGKADGKPVEPAHVKAECALRDHPAYGRWVRQQPSGRLVIDRAKVDAEERLDGKYLLSTSDPDPDRGGHRPGLQEPPRSRTRLPRFQVHPRTPPRPSSSGTADPGSRPALLAGVAVDPCRGTLHGTDVAADRDRARPGACRDPHRHRRQRRPRHPAQHHPNRHSCRLQGHPAPDHHHPEPSLTSTNTPNSHPRERGHTTPCAESTCSA